MSFIGDMVKLYILHGFLCFGFSESKQTPGYQNDNLWVKFVGSWELCANKSTSFLSLDDSKSFRFQKGGGMQNCNSAKVREILNFRSSGQELFLNYQHYSKSETETAFHEINNDPVAIDFEKKLLIIETDKKYVYKFYFSQQNELVLKLNLEETKKANE